MSFVALSPQLNGQYRVAYPVQHGTKWVSPFIATPASANPSLTDFEKITVKDENGISAERYFKIIDTNNFQDPIDLDNTWPTNPVDSTNGICILSCCNTAIKIESLKDCFFNVTPQKCPMCRATPFTATIIDAKAPLTGGAPATAPLGRNHLINRTLTKISGLVSIILGLFFLREGVELLSKNLSSAQAVSYSKMFNTLGVGFILTGIGATLKAVSSINPNHSLTDKIKNIARDLFIGASCNWIGASILLAGKYTLLTSVLAGSSFFIITIGSAVLYAKFLC